MGGWRIGRQPSHRLRRASLAFRVRPWVILCGVCEKERGDSERLGIGTYIPRSSSASSKPFSESRCRRTQEIRGGSGCGVSGARRCPLSRDRDRGSMSVGGTHPQNAVSTPGSRNTSMERLQSYSRKRREI